ncbi:MAG: hypothetical protein HY082_07030 [Gammaproteobacteria bacterium]|nr:hypothetical protein [Gammaproteobacteria bacterium]
MPTLHRACRLILPLGAMLILGGCVTGGILGERDAALVTSRYEELERIGEREIAGLKQVPSPKLMPLCMSYSKLKRYNKLFPCLDRLEDNIRRGDKRFMDFDEFTKRNPLMAGLAMMGSGIAGGISTSPATLKPSNRRIRQSPTSRRNGTRNAGRASRPRPCSDSPTRLAATAITRTRPPRCLRTLARSTPTPC